MPTDEEVLKELIKKWKEYCSTLLTEIEHLKDELKKYRGH